MTDVGLKPPNLGKNQREHDFLKNREKWSTSGPDQNPMIDRPRRTFLVIFGKNDLPHPHIWRSTVFRRSRSALKDGHFWPPWISPSLGKLKTLWTCRGCCSDFSGQKSGYFWSPEISKINRTRSGFLIFNPDLVRLPLPSPGFSVLIKSNLKQQPTRLTRVSFNRPEPAKAGFAGQARAGTTFSLL